MEFHEHLHSIGTKEGLKERKLQKAVESFTWNITILKVRGQAVSDAGDAAVFLSAFPPFRGTGLALCVFSATEAIARPRRSKGTLALRRARGTVAGQCGLDRAQVPWLARCGF